MVKKLSRRKFIEISSLVGSGLCYQSFLPAWAQSGQASLKSGDAITSNLIDLVVSESRGKVAGKKARFYTLNGQFPAPLLRWKEGDDLTIRILNHLDEETSIHWHGLLLPWQMDGVPGVTFPGIPSRGEFTYRFPLRQAGTYWYHSHSGLQEQSGHYGPIIIDPAGTDPVSFDREHVILLSDWTFENPRRVFSKLKKMSDNYNFQQRTIEDFFEEVQAEGYDAVMTNRLMWGDMRMNPTDISDVTGSTYTYLTNGLSPAENWTGLFRKGEKVRLRFINASAMSIFNVRIPGLPMTVVQADGLDVQPVETDEFQIGTAETFDVIVEPGTSDAYTVMCESNDRSGYALATLAIQQGMQAEIPPLRPRPTLSMKDMGMSSMDMGNHMSMEHQDKNHGNASTHGLHQRAMEHDISIMESMDHSAMNYGASDVKQSTRAVMHQNTPDMMGMNGSALMDEIRMQEHNHPLGPGVMNVAMNPVSRLNERPLGLENEPHRVLVYSDLKSLAPNPDKREPSREMELHLTSNMERYMWSFDGQKYSEVKDPIIFHENERLRLTLVNDTMMPHPIHLHGMYFDVVTSQDHNKPRKHTIVVKPGEKMSLDITADALGDWAFHCHFLYHMKAGMMRVISVREQNT
ncbi:MAG: copper resistance system multicopper oxidase [Gammaproteobacteria bacterium]|nr:copper resistance system multicopper oxidase [Gammaproteobacteria bacterium]